MENETVKSQKYELVQDKTITLPDGTKLYAIRALTTFYTPFGYVYKGQFGGFIESQYNLSQDGKCWIGVGAVVYEKATVTDNALVTDLAIVRGYAKVNQNAYVHDKARVYGFARVTGHAVVKHKAEVFDRCTIKDYSVVKDEAKVSGVVIVSGKSNIKENSIVYDEAIVYNSIIRGNSEVFGRCLISDNAEIYDSKISGQAEIRLATVYNSTISGKVTITVQVRIQNQDIESLSDFIIFKNWWSSGRYFAYFTKSDKFQVGCFYGSGEELVRKAYIDNIISGAQYENIVLYVEKIKAQIKLMSHTKKLNNFYISNN